MPEPRPRVFIDKERMQGKRTLILRHQRWGGGGMKYKEVIVPITVSMSVFVFSFPAFQKDTYR